VAVHLAGPHRLLTAGAHYLLGGIRPEAETDKILPAVKAHLSILLALILAVRAWGYWLDRYELLYSQRGTVTGAAFTDVNAELPALYLLIGVSVIAIGLVLFSIRRAGFLVPGAAVGLLVVASIILQGAYPAVIQRVQVDPQELAREQEFIQRNLEATRLAYGLSDVDRVPFSIQNDLGLEDVIDNDITFLNVRLWDPNVLETTYQQLQSLRPYYEFNSVATDRYEIDGAMRQVMLATRELSQLPETSTTGRTGTSPSPTASASSPRRSTRPTPRASRSSSPPTSPSPAARRSCPERPVGDLLRRVRRPGLQPGPHR
jgi:uncharacterized protein